MNRNRRDFIKRFSATLGCFAATADAIASTRLPVSPPGDRQFSFPQGLASGDPQPDAVMLWTRVATNVSTATPPTRIGLTLQVAADRTFAKPLLTKTLSAESSADHTARCFVDGLNSDRHYFYRFTAEDGSVSQIGRTRTAPAANAERDLRIAVFSCQHYEHGFFSAYRRCLHDDETVPSEEKIDLVVHVGDFIYESIHSRFLPTMNGKSKPVRSAADFPSGSRQSAISLDDFRHLYKTYLSDPDLLAMRANYPFVQIWDDHEVFNDYYQSFRDAAPLQQRKLAGNRAWFEYIPALLSEADTGPAGANHARDFKSAEVVDAPATDFDDAYLSHEKNNLAAIQSMTIYRALRWGRLVDMLLLDGRSYRGPRGVDTAMLGTDEIAYPELPIPAQLIATLNAGQTANNGNPPDTVRYYESELPNSRKHSPRGAMLGDTQKAWLCDSLQGSTAKWKIICNNTPLASFGFDTSFMSGGTKDGVLWTDSWDGYPLEREELMQFIYSAEISNVVSLSGDRHAHFAGLIYTREADGTAKAVLPELIGAAVSAASRAAIQIAQLRENEQLSRLTGYPNSVRSYRYKNGPGLNGWLLHGHQSARTMHDTGDEKTAQMQSDPTVNPHLWYADTDAHGYYLVHFSTTSMRSEFVTIPTPLESHGNDSPPVIRRVTSEVRTWEPGESPRFDNINVAGEPPILGIKTGGAQA